MEIAGVRTVIRTSRYDECHRFYGKVLGWPVFTEYQRGDIRGCSFGGRNWGIEIVSDPSAGADDNRCRASIEVADVRAVRDQISASQPDIGSIDDMGWAYGLMVAAPDGYRLLFFTRKSPPAAS